MVKRILFVFIFSLASITCFSITVGAEVEMDCYDEYRDMLDALPDDVSALLPDKLFSDNSSDISDGAKEVLSFDYVLKIFFRYIGLEARNVIKLFASILGILILSALMNSAKASFSSSGISGTFSLISTGALLLIAFTSEYAVISSVATFFSRLCSFTNSLLPLTAVLYAMGGNIAGAVVHHSSLMIFMSIVENFCAQSAMPIAGTCMALSTVSVMAPELNVCSLTSFFKKTYTQALSFLMTIFMTVMGAQSHLAGKSDTLSGRAVKFAVGNLIPTVGSALSGSLSTVAASVEYIRASVGVIGIVAIILMLAPTLVTLIMTKLSFGLLSGAAEILGCESEKKIISELASINGFLLALAAICSVSLIFIMTLFVKCSSASGGGAL